VTETISQASSDLSVRVARSVAEIEALRPAWEALPGDIVSGDVDFFLTMIRASPRAPTPYVLALERGGAIAAISAGRLEDVELAASVGYRKIYAPRVRAITISYGGVLGDSSPETARLIVDRLQDPLQAGEADVVRFRSVRVGSPLHRAAAEAPRFARRQHVSTRTAHWRLDLPSTYDAFLGSLSSSTREGVRRYSRKLERELGERSSLVRYRREDELDSFFTDAGTVAAKTYQHGLGVAVTDDPTLRQLIKLAARRGWFRSWVLSIAGEPAAFWHGIAYRGTFTIGVPGYDPAYARLRTGTYVLMKAVEELCADDEVDKVDFGFGDAEYKRRFGTDRWDEEDVLVYAPTFRGVRVNMTRTAVLGAAGAARRVAGSDRIANVKKRWRGRLSASSRHGAGS
jgi:CelD/BcsL family acetyltransferase involved in cellulose biosynthesis